jgi:RimJ/RimL family protein N-acetyltransferase
MTGMPRELLTARLRLRAWRETDGPAMAAINRDPEVTRHLNRPVDEPAIAAFLDSRVSHWRRHGFGFYAVESREPGLAGRFLGFVGVEHPTFLPAVAERRELGWRLARGAWGRGLATEAAIAARDQAFATLSVTSLVSIIHPQNLRSRRVARKLGMSIETAVYNPVLRRRVDLWAVSAPR